MRLLDLFCGAGGASAGYAAAGFDVVGVDHNPQPNYPFEFVEADAIAYAEENRQDFDVVHASPPCQRYSIANRGLGNASDKVDLVARTRDVLAGSQYIIENVYGAPLRFPILLCGSMFGLRCTAGWLRRHRFFECSSMLLGRLQCQHEEGLSVGVYGRGTNRWHRRKLGRNVRVDELRDAMGIQWMTRDELNQAIPPAYTKWLGEHVARQWCLGGDHTTSCGPR